MLKALSKGVIWLSRVCRVAWCSGRALKDWQTGLIIPVHKRGDRREGTNYWAISLAPWKILAMCLENRWLEIIEPIINTTAKANDTTDILQTFR